VIELLRTELNERIPKALDDEEGPWKLLAYLEQVQPTMVFEQEGVRAPSYSLHLIVEEMEKQLGSDASEDQIKDCCLKTAGECLDEETKHLLRSARVLLDKTEETAKQVSSDRIDALENYFDGISSNDEDEQPARRPQEILEEIVGVVSTPLRLSTDELRRLPNGDDNVKQVLEDQINKTVKSLAITRTINAIEMRLEESLNMRTAQLIDLDWDEINEGIYRSVDTILNTRTKNLLAANGTITQNVDNALQHSHENLELYDRLVDLVIAMSTGSRMAIDPRTHQKVMRNVRIMNTIFLAAKQIQDTPVKEITADILEHLEEIRQHLEEVWGAIEFERFRLAGVPLAQLDSKIQETLSEEFGSETLEQIISKHPEDLTDDQQEILTRTLGARIQNEIYRHILVSVFSEHWVEYLTKVDALRVSIGMEAFAQRDPLVQYKSEAAGMFKQLLSDIRAGVIAKMFLFQPRRAGAAAEKAVSPQPSDISNQNVSSQSSNNKKKRKRH
jgi:preprotein translocase subunit SecA